MGVEAYPDFVARFYDTVYDRIRSGTDHDYYLRRILESGGRVLEIGVGTGRIFSEAIGRGADIYGIDGSEEMLHVLRRKIPETAHPRVRCQDVRALAWDGLFRLIVAPFRVLSHLVTLDDQLTALRRVEAHLAPDGLFIFDLFVPDPTLAQYGMESTMDFEGEWSPGENVQRFVSVEADPVRQINLVSMRFVWREDGLEFDRTWTFPMRYFYRYEIEHLVARSGLVVKAIYGDYEEHELTRHSKDFVVVCGHT